MRKTNKQMFRSETLQFVLETRRDGYRHVEIEIIKEGELRIEQFYGQFVSPVYDVQTAFDYCVCSQVEIVKIVYFRQKKKNCAIQGTIP